MNAIVRGTRGFGEMRGSHQGYLNACRGTAVRTIQLMRSASFDRAPPPPVGLVEVRIRPAPSLPTQSPADGHDCEKSSTGFSPGATSSGDDQFAEVPAAALLVLDTCPSDVPATHSDAFAPRHVNAFDDPEESISATQVAPCVRPNSVAAAAAGLAFLLLLRTFA